MSVSVHLYNTLYLTLNFTHIMLENKSNFNLIQVKVNLELCELTGYVRFCNTFLYANFRIFI